MPPITTAASTTTIGNRLTQLALRDLAHVRRIDSLYLRGKVKQTDVLRVYAGTYLNFYTQVERALEDLFLGLLTAKLVHASQPVRAHVVIPKRSIAIGIINGANSYTDWMPFHKFTVKRASGFFAGGLPFEKVNKADRKILEEASTLRNAIAHGSEHALRQFERVFTIDPSTRRYIIPPKQRNPASYLRGIHAGPQTRLAYRITALVAVVTRMCS